MANENRRHNTRQQELHRRSNMSPAMKSRVATVLKIASTAFQYGFVPTVIYLGFKKGAEEGMPELTLSSLLWS